MNNNFSEFTGFYEISKTLRFQLKPMSDKKDFFSQIDFNNEK